MNMLIQRFSKKIKSLLACSLVALSATVFTVNATAAETIRVGHFSWPGYGFLYVNQHHNLSPDLNFEFTVIEDPVQLFALLGTNQLDVVFSTIEFGPILAAENMGSKLVALTNLGYGSDDIVVHPRQSEGIASSMEQRGVPHEHHLFTGEGHGWRKEETIVEYYALIERFLGRYL